MDICIHISIRATPEYQQHTWIGGNKTDRITNTVPYPSHLPTIPDTAKNKINAAYSWHLRLNHTSLNTITTMAKSPHQLGIPWSLRTSQPPMHLQTCSRSHFQNAPHRNTATRPPPGHTVAMYIAGPLPKTAAGSQCFLTITELNTRLKLVYLLKNRAETGECLTKTINKIERNFGHPMARIRCDNANEFLSKTLIRQFGQLAIDIYPTTPHTPEENAISERPNPTILARVRATIHTAHMPFAKYWAYFVLHTVGKTNATLQRTIGDIPRRLWENIAHYTAHFDNSQSN